MKSSNFIWTDLSTYNTSKSIEFYEQVFNWKIKNEQEYFIATLDDIPIAAIFETPDYLKKIKMPHFWMSYFQVEDVVETVKLAQALGAIIEVKSTDFYNGKIALIRDTQGAGFTVYDGDNLNFEANRKGGVIAYNELHVSDSNNVISFYEKIFNW